METNVQIKKHVARISILVDEHYQFCLQHKEENYKRFCLVFTCILGDLVPKSIILFVQCATTPCVVIRKQINLVGIVFVSMIVFVCVFVQCFATVCSYKKGNKLGGHCICIHDCICMCICAVCYHHVLLHEKR